MGEKESEILTGQIMMLNDPFMLSQMNDSIDAGNCAEAVSYTHLDVYKRQV